MENWQLMKEFILDKFQHKEIINYQLSIINYNAKRCERKNSVLAKAGEFPYGTYQQFIS